MPSLPTSEPRPARRAWRAWRATVAACVAAVVAAGWGALPATGEAFVYWTNFGAGTIGRANLDGTGLNQAFITGASSPRGVAVDARYVYWASTGGANTIARANLDGTSTPKQDFITGALIPTGVAVDAGHIYWANYTAGTIGRANLDGTAANQSFITAASGPYGVAVDAGHIYWANRSDRTIGRANLDGTGANQTFITSDSLPHGVAVDAGHIYWADYGTNTIGRANLDGTGADQSFITGASSPYWVAVDAGHIYWTNTGTNAIGRANLDGSGADQSFISTTGSPFGLAVDGPAVSAPGAAFGAQTVGTRSTALPVLATNTGTQPLVVAGAAIAGAGAAAFAITSDGCTGRTIAPGHACAVSVRFTPAATGDAAASLVLTDDASDSPQPIPLTGTGLAANAGPAGAAGLAGPVGPVGPAGPVGAPGTLVLAAYRASVTARRVTVRYLLTGRAAVTLKVRTPRGSTVTAARATGKAGLNTISWNRRIKGKKAKPGTYRLTVTATTGGRTSSTTITARLR